MNAIRDRIPTVSSLPLVDDTDDVDETEPEWDRQGRVSRLVSIMKIYPFLAASVVFFFLMLVLYLYPVLPRAHGSVSLPFFGFLVLAFAVWGLWNRMQAYGVLQTIDLHVNYRGNSITPRLGHTVDDVEDGDIMGFKPLRVFQYGGLKLAYEEFRDRFSRREIGQHKEKYHRAESDGSGEVVDAFLESQTTRASKCRNDIEVFRNIYVTHSGKQRPNLDSKDVDSISTLPPTIDSRTSADVRTAFEKQSLDRNRLKEELEMMDSYLKEMREYVDPAGQPLIDDVVGILETINEIEKDDKEQEPLRVPTDSNGRGQGRGNR